MADDHSQRPYRASEPPVRGSAKTPGSDPLAELARLIGQTDPFAEFGRDPTRRTTAQQPSERADWDAPINSPYAPRTTQSPAGNGYYTGRAEQAAATSHGHAGQTYGRESFEETPLPADADPYAPEHDAHGYSDQAGYQHDGYEYDQSQQVGDEYYDDVPPSRRRLGVMAIVGVLALAVIGTAGAFGYRALFGSSGSSQAPPVIKADTGPTKVPATGKDAQSGKLITDRVADRAQSEKLVSREEQPMDRAATAVLTQSPPQSALGSGVISNEPKKIRTIAIHPDQPNAGEPQSPAPPLAAARAAPAPARPAPPPPRAPEPSTADAEQNAPAAAARPAPQPRQAATTPNNVPLSLNPDAAPARAAAPAAPARTASVAPPAQAAAPPPAQATAVAAAAGGPGSYVQVSSQRSEAEAQAAFKSLQAKYPDQLGRRQPLIRQVDLGSKGTYYRAMVGPFANPSEAGELCTSLKTAGGQCLIQKN